MPSIFDRTTLPPEIEQFDEREFRWAWEELAQRGLKLPAWGTILGRNERERALDSALLTRADSGALVEFLLDVKKEKLLSLESFDWVNWDDDRQMIWLLNLLRNALTFTAFVEEQRAPELMIRGARKQAFIFLFDILDLSKQQKESWLARMKVEWAQVRTPDSLTRWLKRSDQKQLEWALTYLVNHGQPSIFTPFVNKDYFAAILTSFDRMFVEDNYRAELFILKMRKTWSQKKYRDSGKAKKAYYLSLSKDTRLMLDQLARQQGISSSEVVESLIRSSNELT